MYPVEVLCRVLQVARSGFYAWRGRRPSARSRENLWLLTRIRACYRAAHARYGSPRIYQDLRAHRPALVFMTKTCLEWAPLRRFYDGGIGEGPTVRTHRGGSLLQCGLPYGQYLRACER